MKIQEGSCSILFSNNVGGTEEPIPSFMKLNDSEGNIPCVKDCIETKEEKKLRLDSFENSNSSFSEIQDKNIPNNDGNVSIDPKLIFDERLECQTIDPAKSNSKLEKSKINFTLKDNDIRKKVSEGFHSSLVLNLESDFDTSAFQSFLLKIEDFLEKSENIAHHLEDALFNAYGEDTASKNLKKCGVTYRSRFRSLQYNLKDKQNSFLRAKLFKGFFPAAPSLKIISSSSISPIDFVKLGPEELANENLSKIRESVLTKSIQESVLPEEFHEVILKRKVNLPNLIRNSETVSDIISVSKPVGISNYFENRSASPQYPSLNAEISTETVWKSPRDPLAAVRGFDSPTKASSVGCFLGKFGSERPIWSGYLTMPGFTSEFIPILAWHVGGRPVIDRQLWNEVLPASDSYLQHNFMAENHLNGNRIEFQKQLNISQSWVLSIDGRLPNDSLLDYFIKLSASNTREIITIALTIRPDTVFSSACLSLYLSIFHHFRQKSRSGVFLFSNCPSIKDAYLFPLAKDDPIPAPLKVSSIAMKNREEHVLLLILVKVKYPTKPLASFRVSSNTITSSALSSPMPSLSSTNTSNEAMGERLEQNIRNVSKWKSKRSTSRKPFENNRFESNNLQNNSNDNNRRVSQSFSNECTLWNNEGWSQAEECSWNMSQDNANTNSKIEALQRPVENNEFGWNTPQEDECTWNIIQEDINANQKNETQSIQNNEFGRSTTPEDEYSWNITQEDEIISPSTLENPESVIEKHGDAWKLHYSDDNQEKYRNNATKNKDRNIRFESKKRKSFFDSKTCTKSKFQTFPGAVKDFNGKSNNNNEKVDGDSAVIKPSPSSSSGGSLKGNDTAEWSLPSYLEPAFLAGKYKVSRKHFI